jgi:hypothetical protein
VRNEPQINKSPDHHTISSLIPILFKMTLRGIQSQLFDISKVSPHERILEDNFTTSHRWQHLDFDCSVDSKVSVLFDAIV